LYKVKPNFLDQHSEISNDVRSIVVDWMVEVQETLELNHETLYLAVKNMDLFLSSPKNKERKGVTPDFPVKRSRLRLLACASLYLASQYDVSSSPQLGEKFSYCT
jgi:G2/mitotic-specific cyclin-B3